MSDARQGAERATLRVDGPPAAALAPAALQSLDSAALARFLSGRRWFGAKGAAPRRVSVHDVVPVSGGDGTDGPYAVARLDVELADGRIARYQLPLAVVEGEVDARAAVVADVEAAGGARARLVDATGEAGFRRLVLAGLERGARYEGERTSWTLTPLPDAPVAELASQPTRVGSAEQSNTSVVCGDRAIFKFFRRLEAGENPDVEIARFLTTRTDFRNVPALLGTAQFEERDGATTVAGMLQELVPGARDAWDVALDAVRAYLHAADDAPPGAFAGEMHELGRVTRALHEALASRPDDPDFAPVAATATDAEAWGARVRDMVHASTELLAAARADGRLKGSDVSIADAVLRRRPEVLGDIEELVVALGDHPGERIRHHGDYHLGQVLKGADGRYMIIDFEGEPARGLAERRAPDAPLRDVAGMLRSFAYAAATAAMERGGVGTDPAVETRSARWERAVREAFLTGYLERGAARFLPADPTAATHLMTLFEMEKVFYELGYELNNRPDWVWIPLRGIGRLLGSPSLPRRERAQPDA